MCKAETKVMNCKCGGNLVFDEKGDIEHPGGYIYSYKCDKCKMLHFYQF